MLKKYRTQTERDLREKTQTATRRLQQAILNELKQIRKLLAERSQPHDE